MSRTNKIAAQLGAYDIDALLITGETNRRYATDFHSTAGAVLVTEGESIFITDGRYIEAARKRIDGVDVRLIKTGEKYTDLIADLVREKGVKRLGFEDETMSCAEFRGWSEAIPAELVPAQRLLSVLRRSKDADELRRMVKAQEITDAAFTEILNYIKPGVTELEIAARLQFAMLMRGAEKMSFDPIVVSGANSSMPHGVPGEKKLEKGDFITMDFGCVYQGYCSDMTRTVVVGKATDEMKKVYNTVLEAQLAGIAAYYPDVPGRDVDRAARDVIAKAGYGEYFTHSFGHSLGLDIHEAPNASPTETENLPLGTAVSAEPGIYIPGKFGVRIEDVVYIGADGNKVLTQSPKQLIEVD